MKLSKIIAPTDLSKLSRAALRYAMELALEQDAELIVYNVISEDGEWFDKDDELNPVKALVPQQRQRLAEFVRGMLRRISGRRKGPRSRRSGCALPRHRAQSR